MKGRRVTMRDVGQAAGVALGTVSRVINGGQSVSKDAAQRVNEAIARLGYEPDALAQSMRTRTTSVIGCIVSDISNPLYASLVNALERSLQEAGYTLLLANSANDVKRELALASAFRRQRIDGLVIAACQEQRNPTLQMLAAQHIPSVVLDRDTDLPGSRVLVDHRGGGMQAARHLLDLGHRRIALLTPGAGLRTGRDRIQGVRDAHTERGLRMDDSLICVESSSMNFAFSEALNLLELPEPPTAFIALGTRILAGVLKAIRHAGRVVPGDVSVVSIGDTDLAMLAYPSVTAVRWDVDELGRSAAQLMLRQLGPDADARPQRITLTTELTLRESCGAPLSDGVRNSRQGMRSPASPLQEKTR